MPMYGFFYGVYLLPEMEFFSTSGTYSRRHKPGDLVSGRRTPESDIECVVCLGFAAKKDKAKEIAQNYLNEVGRIHKEDLDDLELGETQVF